MSGLGGRSCDVDLEDVRILQARGLTAAEVAAQLGISRTTLWRITSGGGR